MIYSYMVLGDGAAQGSPPQTFALGAVPSSASGAFLYGIRSVAFNRSDPNDLLALKTEVNTDPVLIGYAAVLDSVEDLLDLLNDPANNVAPLNGVPPLLAGDLWDILVDETVTAATENRLDWLFSNSGDGFLTDFSSKREKISGMDLGLGNAIAAMTRPLSRAEVLFSELDANGTNEFVVISRDDWFAARDS